MLLGRPTTLARKPAATTLERDIIFSEMILLIFKVFAFHAISISPFHFACLSLPLSLSSDPERLASAADHICTI